MKDGTSLIVHIHRLKRAYGPGPEAFTSAPTPLTKRSDKPRQSKQVVAEPERMQHSNEGNSFEVRTKPPMNSNTSTAERECEQREIRTPSPGRSGQCDSEWEADSAHLRRKLQAGKSTREVTYQLHSRSVYEPEIEEQRRDEPSSATSSRSIREPVSEVPTPTQGEYSDQAITVHGHPYNLRSRTHST